MERGVSEVLGYIYILGIVMAVLAIVFVQVHGMVEDMKRSVLSQSLEQSFKRIQYIIYSVLFGDVPSQEVEIELQGGTLWLDSLNPELIVAFLNTTDRSLSSVDCSKVVGQNFGKLCLNLSTGRLYPFPCSLMANYNYTVCAIGETPGRLVYEYGDLTLSIESGAVFSKSRQGYSKLLHDPRILFNATSGPGHKFLVLSVPLLRGELSIGGGGRSKFTVSEGNVTSVRVDDLKGLEDYFTDVYIILKDTEHRRAWCDFFGRKGDFNLSLPKDACYGNEPCSCYIADNPTARINLTGSDIHQLIAVFREVKIRS